MLFKEFSNIFIDDTYTILRVINMIANKAIFTDEALVLSTEFRSNFMRVRVAIDLRLWENLLNLFSKMLVCTKLNWVLKTIGCTMIRVAE
jgi:hypothetical protein